jgi:hypothetical protein
VTNRYLKIRNITNQYRITCCHIPFNKNVLYVGDIVGNVSLLKLPDLQLSNLVIDLRTVFPKEFRKLKDVSIVDIEINPESDDELLIAYSCNKVILFDMLEIETKRTFEHNVIKI